MAQDKWKLPKGATWREKLEREHPNHGKVVAIPPRMQKRWGRGTMLIPRPLDVDAVMRRPRKGQLVTSSQIRDELARMAGTDSACPMTTGIFIRMAAEAAAEDQRAGKKRVTPFWRTVKDNGDLNEKFPGGVKAQAALLTSEGHTIEPAKGKRPPRAVNVEKKAVKL